jgi:hypothetical protein
MHGSPHRHLDRFQVESASLALVLKNKPQQRAYFPFDFLPDRFGRFFPERSKCQTEVVPGKSPHSRRAGSG